MLTKSKLAIAAVLIFGAASAAQAGKDVDPEATGGFVWGPMGQRMGGSAVNPAYHRSLGGRRGDAYAFSREGFREYAYVPSTRYRYHRDFWDWR